MMPVDRARNGKLAGSGIKKLEWLTYAASDPYGAAGFAEKR